MGDDEIIDGVDETGEEELDENGEPKVKDTDDIDDMEDEEA